MVLVFTKLTDMMQKWTVGYYRSGLHRVVNSSTKARYSAPFFMNGNLDIECHPLSGSGEVTVIEERIRRSDGDDWWRGGKEVRTLS